MRTLFLFLLVFLFLSHTNSLAQASIGNFVWLDCDANGIQDGFDKGLSIGYIQLFHEDYSSVNDLSGNPVLGIFSDAVGFYEFTNLPAGDYIVTIFFDPHSIFLTQNNVVGGADDATDVANDSDFTADGEIATSFVIHLTNGENFNTLDAGFIPSTSIGDRVWHDNNGNGIQEVGEPGIEGIEVRLTNLDGSVTQNIFGQNIAPIFTDNLGNYSFGKLKSREYLLTVVPPDDWHFAPANVGDESTDSEADMNGRVLINLSNAVCTNAANDAFSFDFGLYKNVAIGGTLWYDQLLDDKFTNWDYSLSGVKVQLKSILGEILQETQTDNSGIYTFDVTPGLYEILVPESNFQDVLSDLKSCYEFVNGNNNPINSDIDNDDNGRPTNGAGSREVSIFAVDIQSGKETDNDGFENRTFDICFKAFCDSTNSEYAQLSCETVTDVLCDLRILENRCFRMNDSLVAPFPTPLCASDGSGAAHNMSWFAFVAGNGDYTIQVEPTACVPGLGGQLGLQAGVYTDCTFAEAVFCQSACSTAPINIQSNSFIPGNIYYFFFDGCSGSICNINFKILGNYTPILFEDVATSLSCLRPNCDTINLHENLFVEVNGTYSGKFYWTIFKPNGIDSTTIITQTKRLKLKINELGNYTIRLDSIVGMCGSNHHSSALNIFSRDGSFDKLQGQVYYDLDENGSFDVSIDIPLENAQITIPSLNMTYLSNPEGKFYADVDSGKYIVFVKVPYGRWKNPIFIDTVVVDSQITYLDVPFQKNIFPNTASIFSLTLSTRCNQDNHSFLTITNTSLNPYRAKVVMDFDDRAEISNFNKPVIQISNSQFECNFDDFAENKPNFRLDFDMNFDESLLGKILTHDFWVIDEGGDTLDHYKLVQEVRCSIDPNDKHVLPDRAGMYNLTLRDEAITYTIRFQNTGNDTAFYVRIDDEMDNSLDLESLVVLETSHAVRTQIHDRKLSFIFDNIMLPDNKANAEASQGFVSFAIACQDSIPEFTTVDNFAEIYFDVNPPVFTNGTKNTIVNSLYDNLNEDFGTIAMCEDLFSSYDGPVSVNDEGLITDPNGDGKNGWQGPINNFIEGSNEVTFDLGFGISYTQKVFLVKKLNTQGTLAHYDLCYDQVPFTVQFPYSSNNFVIVESIDPPIQVLTKNTAGCDSTFTISANVIEVAGEIQVLSNIAPIGKLKFIVNGLSTPMPNIIHVLWYNEENEEVFDNNPDNDLFTIDLDESGGYHCIITVESNGVSCDFISPPVVLNLITSTDIEFPNTVTISPVPIKDVCYFNANFIIYDIFILSVDGKPAGSYTNLNESKYNVNTGSLSSGMYIVKVVGERQIFFQKVIVSH